MAQNLGLVTLDPSVESWGGLTYPSAVTDIALRGLETLGWTYRQSGWDKTTDLNRGTTDYNSHLDTERLSGTGVGLHIQLGGTATHDTYHESDTPTGHNWSDDSSLVHGLITGGSVQILVPGYGGKDFGIGSANQQETSIGGTVKNTFGGSDGGITWKGSITTTFDFTASNTGGDQFDLTGAADKLTTVLDGKLAPTASSLASAFIPHQQAGQTTLTDNSTGLLNPKG